MSTRAPTLTNRDHNNMDAFLNHVLEDFKNGELTKAQVAGALTQIIAAIDTGNYGDAIHWFEQGRKVIRFTAR